MVKKRERNEVEYLRGLVRELKAEVRHLKKELGATSKRARRYETHIDNQVEPEVKEEPIATCAECGGTTSRIDLGIKSITVCSNCGHRVLTKKAKNG